MWLAEVDQEIEHAASRPNMKCSVFLKRVKLTDHQNPEAKSTFSNDLSQELILKRVKP